MNRVSVAMLAAALALCSCGGKKVRVVTPAAPAPPPQVGQIERGMASWYGHPYHGRPAADGEIYDMETMVAAHRTLPFQTVVRVRNLANGKTVDVRIIDRGPFVGGRIIDLSHAAAEQIELVGPGVAEVEVMIVATPPNPEPALFGVQVGAFAERANADRAQKNMEAAYGAARIVERFGNTPLWRVLAGQENSQANAEALAQRIRAEQNVPEAFVVRLDP
jgi:rare lipoprotein A